MEKKSLMEAEISC